GIRGGNVTGVQTCALPIYLGHMLRSAANEVIDLASLFRTFEMINPREAGHAQAGGQATSPVSRPSDARVTKVDEAPAQTSHHRKNGRAACRERIESIRGKS